VVADEGTSRRRDEGGDSREELERREDHVLGLAGVRALDAIRDAAVAEAAQAREGDGGAEGVAAEALAGEIVTDADAGVEVEAAGFDGAVGERRGLGIVGAVGRDVLDCGAWCAASTERRKRRGR